MYATLILWDCRLFIATVFKLLTHFYINIFFFNLKFLIDILSIWVLLSILLFRRDWSYSLPIFRVISMLTTLYGMLWHLFNIAPIIKMWKICRWSINTIYLTFNSWHIFIHSLRWVFQLSEVLLRIYVIIRWQNWSLIAHY
jgi:hypothetical protein